MSRQLDAWVAEYVMELEVSDDSKYYRKYSDCYLDFTFTKIPNYSTDMNAAMKVVNSENIGIHWDITSDETYNGMQYYAVAIGIYSAEHQSLPIAICLAALRAVGKDALVDKYLRGEG